MTARFFLSASAIMGFLSVSLGAFAAHALKARLDEYSLSVFQTGVQYQFYHTFAVALVGLLLPHYGPSMLRGSGICFLIGTFIFSSSLYLLAVTGIKWLGAITPIGGVGLLVGWVLLLVSAIKFPQ